METSLDGSPDDGYPDTQGYITTVDATNAHSLIPLNVPFVVHPDLLHPGQRTAPHYRLGDDPLVNTPPPIPLHTLPFLISILSSDNEESLKGSLENLRMLLVHFIGMGNGGKDSLPNSVDGDEEITETEQVNSLKKETRKKVELRRFLRLLLDFSPETAWTSAATGGLSSDILYDFCCTSDEDSDQKEPQLKKFINQTRLDALLQERSQDKKQQIIDAAWMGYRSESFDNLSENSEGGSPQPLMHRSVVEGLSSLADSLNEMKQVISYAVSQFSQKWQDQLNKYDQQKYQDEHDDVSVPDNDFGDKCSFPYFEDMLLDFMGNDPNFLEIMQHAWDTTSQRDLPNLSLVLTLHGVIPDTDHSKFGIIDMLPVRAFTECLWGMLQPLCIGAVLKMKPLMWRNDTTLMSKSEYYHMDSLNSKLEVATKGALRSVTMLLQSPSSDIEDHNVTVTAASVYGMRLPSNFKNLLKCVGTLIPAISNESCSMPKVTLIMLADGASLSTRLLGDLLTLPDLGTASKVDSLLGERTSSSFRKRSVGSIKARTKDGNREYFTAHQGLDDSNWEVCLHLTKPEMTMGDDILYQVNIQGSSKKTYILDWRLCSAGYYQYSRSCLSLWSNQAGRPSRLSTRSERHDLELKQSHQRNSGTFRENDCDNPYDEVIGVTQEAITVDRGDGEGAAEKRERDMHMNNTQVSALDEAILPNIDDFQTKSKRTRLESTSSPVLPSRVDGTQKEFEKKGPVQHLLPSPNPGFSQPSLALFPSSLSGTSLPSGGILGSILPTLPSRVKLDCVLGVMTKKAGLLGDQPQSSPLLSLFTTPRIIGKPGPRAPLGSSRGRGVLDTVEISQKSTENSSLRHSALLSNTGMGCASSNNTESCYIFNKDFSLSNVVTDIQRKYINKTLQKLLQSTHSDDFQGFMKDKNNDALIGKLHGGPSRFSPVYRVSDEAPTSACVMSARLEDALAKVCCCVCRKIPLQTPLSYIDVSPSVKEFCQYPAVLGNSDRAVRGRGQTPLLDFRTPVIPDSPYQPPVTCFNPISQLISISSIEDKFCLPPTVSSVSLRTPAAPVLGLSPSPITMAKQPAVFPAAPVSQPVLKIEGAVGVSTTKKESVSGSLLPKTTNPHWELIVNTFNQIILSDLHPMIFKCCGSLQCGACCSFLKCAVCRESHVLDRNVKKEIMKLWKNENGKYDKEEPVTGEKIMFPSLVDMCRIDALALFAYFCDRKASYYTDRQVESKKIDVRQNKDQGVLGGAPTTVRDDVNAAQTMAYNDIVEGLNSVKNHRRTRVSESEKEIPQSIKFPANFPPLFIALLFFSSNVVNTRVSKSESMTTPPVAPLLFRPASMREYPKKLLIAVEEAMPLLQQEEDAGYRAV